jgi:hypothetical protein
MEPWERYRHALAKIIARRQPFHSRRYVEQQSTDFDPRLLDLRVRGTVYIDGYWQSEGYFKDVEERIREDLKIKHPEDVTNIQMAQRIQDSESVGIHVRWFEKPNHGAACSHNIDENYYSRAVEKVSTKIAQAHYFVFSDYPNEARKLLNLPDSVTCYVNHNTGAENAYADLWLMAQCHHFIIANSTFSWWGAWLSEYKQKIVIAPAIKQTGISAWGFEGLLPSGWNQI